MTNLKRVECARQVPAPTAPTRDPVPAGAHLVAASLLHSSGAAPRRWDERTQVEDPLRVIR